MSHDQTNQLQSQSQHYKLSTKKVEKLESHEALWII